MFTLEQMIAAGGIGFCIGVLLAWWVWVESPSARRFKKKTEEFDRDWERTRARMEQARHKMTRGGD